MEQIDIQADNVRRKKIWGKRKKKTCNLKRIEV